MKRKWTPRCVALTGGGDTFQSQEAKPWLPWTGTKHRPVNIRSSAPNQVLRGFQTQEIQMRSPSGGPAPPCQVQEERAPCTRSCWAGRCSSAEGKLDISVPRQQPEGTPAGAASSQDPGGDRRQPEVTETPPSQPPAHSPWVLSSSTPRGERPTVWGSNFQPRLIWKFFCGKGYSELGFT